MPYAATSSDPICFEYINTGVCGRLQRGETHALARSSAGRSQRAGQSQSHGCPLAGCSLTRRGVRVIRLIRPRRLREPSRNLLGTFPPSRLGEICRYRHLDASHPDVIADRVRQGKLPASALAAPGGGGQRSVFSSTTDNNNDDD